MSNTRLESEPGQGPQPTLQLTNHFILVRSRLSSSFALGGSKTPGGYLDVQHHEIYERPCYEWEALNTAISLRDNSRQMLFSQADMPKQKQLR